MLVGQHADVAGWNVRPKAHADRQFSRCFHRERPQVPRRGFAGPGHLRLQQEGKASPALKGTVGNAHGEYIG